MRIILLHEGTRNGSSLVELKWMPDYAYLRGLTLGDYDAIIELWQLAGLRCACKGVTVAMHLASNLPRGRLS